MSETSPKGELETQSEAPENSVKKSRGWRFRIPVALVVLVLGILVFEHLIKDRVFPKRWGVVEEGLVYRAGQIHPSLIESTLRDHNIEKVIDLQYWEDKPGHIAEKAAVEALNIEQERFPLNGEGTGNVEHYLMAMRSIHEARMTDTPVLVHCAAGTQRTGGVLAAYRTLVLGISPEQAVEELLTYDWRPERDQILLDYLNDNIAYIAEQLVLDGIISEVPTPLPYFASPLEA